jgi:hypothetical protein
MTFSAFQSVTGRWWVSKSWPKSRHRYGGQSLIWAAPDEATAVAVAAELTTRMERR